MLTSHKKLTAIALCGMLGIGILGTSMGFAEASSRKSHEPAPVYHTNAQPHRQDNPSPPRKQEPPKPEASHASSRRAPAKESDRDQYSEGDRNTAAIVGAVIGYAIGKAT